MLAAGLAECRLGQTLGLPVDGRLLAEAVDLSLSRRLLVFALAPDGSVTKSVIDMAAFEAYPTPALTVGQDGELYRLLHQGQGDPGAADVLAGYDEQRVHVDAQTGSVAIVLSPATARGRYVDSSLSFWHSRFWARAASFPVGAKAP